MSTDRLHSGKTSTHALTLSISDRVVIFPRFVLRVVVFEVFKKTAPYVNYVCNYFILSLYTNSNHEKNESVRKLACVSQKSRELFGPENISRHISGAFFAFKKVFFKTSESLPIFSGIFPHSVLFVRAKKSRGFYISWASLTFL